MYKNLRLLLVEDDDGDAELLVRHLGRAGYEVDAVRVETEAALASALDVPCDAVLLDFRLPHLSGHAALEIIRGSGIDMPVIVVSGTIGEEAAVSAMRAGAADFIPKSNLARLVPALARELREAAERRTRRQQERELHALQERFRATFEQAAVGMAHGTTDGIVLRVNEKFASLLGWSVAEMAGRRFLEFTFPGDIEKSQESIRPVVDGSRSHVTIEKRFVRRDGTVIWTLATYSLAAAPEPYVIAVIQDISLQKHTEEALRVSEGRFRSTLENSYDITTIIGTEGRVKYVSPSIRLLGWPPEELIGTNAFERVHPDDRENVHRVLTAGVTRPGDTGTAEYRYRAKDGTWHWLESVGRNLLSDPDVLGIVVNSRDVTERRAYQRQLDQAARVSSLGRLAASMAHEFNNVLMGIQPFAEIIRRSATEARTREACDYIERSVVRGRSVAQEILRFTQPAEPAMTSIAIREWLDTVATEMRGVFGARYPLAIEIVARDSFVAADRGQITQAITNLLVNARDAMPNGGPITIRVDAVERDGTKFVDLRVQDAGCGIPENAREHIFTPLYTTKAHGTGLGLAITHHIVMRHGGFITFESVPDGGTTFHVLLPRTEASAPIAIEAKPAVATHHTGARVLIVEDEWAVADGLQMLLEVEGFEVHLVRTGREALRVAEEVQPDLAIIDVGLPDINGGEVAKMLVARRPDLAVIFSTGHGDATFLNGLLPEEQTRCIQKPYDGDALLVLIDELLAGVTA